MSRLNRERGASLITAIFLITALAALGALMTRLTVHGNRVTFNEYLSARAFNAAESGLDWALYDIVMNTTGTAGVSGGVVQLDPSEVDPNKAALWFNTTADTSIIDSGTTTTKTYYQITSHGMAGGTSTNTTVVRTLTLQFME